MPKLIIFTDKHEASRGLSATAELLVFFITKQQNIYLEGRDLGLGLGQALRFWF